MQKVQTTSFVNREGAATNGIENTPIPSRKAEIVYLGADSAPCQGRGYGGHQTYGGVGMVYVRSYYR